MEFKEGDRVRLNNPEHHLNLCGGTIVAIEALTVSSIGRRNALSGYNRAIPFSGILYTVEFESQGCSWFVPCYTSELIMMTPSIVLNCECGAEKVSHTRHSTWCPKWSNNE